MSTQAKQHNVSLFTGIPVQVPNRFSYYNAMIALGDGSGHYYKRYLVPFGEYVPFAKLFRGLMGFLSLPMSDMISGPANQPDLKAGNIILAPFICYEIAYDEALLQSAPQSSVLVVISDDAWFGDSLAPFQHLEIGQFRAIQSGRDLLFSSNDGVTALVNDHGDAYKQIPQFKQLVLTGEFQPRIGMTPWLYYGNQPIILIALFALFVLAVWERRR
jgi:apolipoprotein N-acyltransferase